LNNVTPDTTTAGAKWTAEASFKDNGTVTGTVATGATAYLTFVPVNGHTYTLSVVIQQTATNADNWLSFGLLTNSTYVGPGFERCRYQRRNRSTRPAAGHAAIDERGDGRGIHLIEHETRCLRRGIHVKAHPADEGGGVKGGGCE